jgi:hypothetical protein
MRNYALNCAIANESIGGSLTSLIRNWFARRETAKLLKADAVTLAALGVTSDDVRAAISLPLSHNAWIALEDMATRRMRKMDRQMTRLRAVFEVVRSDDARAGTRKPHVSPPNPFSRSVGLKWWQDGSTQHARG